MTHHVLNVPQNKAVGEGQPADQTEAQPLRKGSAAGCERLLQDPCRQRVRQAIPGVRFQCLVSAHAHGLRNGGGGGVAYVLPETVCLQMST